MIDLRRLRAEPDVVRAGLARRGIDLAPLDRVVELDAEQRRLSHRRDEIRSRVKDLSRQVGQRRRDGDQAGAEQLAEESRELGDEERKLAGEADRLTSEIRAELLVLPNVPSPDAPDGADERANVVARVEGYDPERYASHQRVPHWDIGSELGILDLERGAKLSGSMFVMYRKAGALLVRALVQLALDRNADAFEEIRPPTLVLTETMVSTGHLPKFVDDAYHLERDDLWAIPTAEVPLTSLARDEVLDEADLPMRLMAHTSCFRREAGSAGRDTRGLLRVHEFDKVEILAYATPAQAPDLHAELLARAESVIRDLGLAYRIVDLCAGDLGISSARTFDIEVYAPGVDRWLEVSSVSWFSDYQARRANVRYRPSGGKGTEVVHTLNGSALAVPRVWAALVETYRRPDGQITVPDILRPYLGGRDLLTAGPSRCAAASPSSARWCRIRPSRPATPATTTRCAG
jgi:seryl-tRNA synthetase